MRPFQIIFNPTSAAELARMPKELQLQILGEFRGLPQQVMNTEIDQFGKLERGGRVLQRFRVGDYRVYFERHELGLVVHRILSRHTLKDFLFRSGLRMQQDERGLRSPCRDRDHEEEDEMVGTEAGGYLHPLYRVLQCYTA